MSSQEAFANSVTWQSSPGKLHILNPLHKNTVHRIFSEYVLCVLLAVLKYPEICYQNCLPQQNTSAQNKVMLYWRLSSAHYTSILLSSRKVVSHDPKWSIFTWTQAWFCSVKLKQRETYLHTMHQPCSSWLAETPCRYFATNGVNTSIFQIPRYFIIPGSHVRRQRFQNLRVCQKPRDLVRFMGIWPCT